MIIGTILERIVTDLWPVINNYHNVHHLYVIGRHDGIYPNHRLITEEECKTDQFKKTFADHYRGNNGLISLDDFDGDVLCCDKCPLSLPRRFLFSSWIRLLNAGDRGSVKIKKDEIILFKDSFNDEKHTMDNILSIQLFDGEQIYYNDTCIIGLFVRINVNII